jgi:hypothetical protein
MSNLPWGQVVKKVKLHHWCCCRNLYGVECRSFTCVSVGVRISGSLFTICEWRFAKTMYKGLQKYMATISSENLRNSPMKDSHFVFRKQCFHFSKLKFPSNFQEGNLRMGRSRKDPHSPRRKFLPSGWGDKNVFRTSEGGRAVNFRFPPWGWYGCFLEWPNRFFLSNSNPVFFGYLFQFSDVFGPTYAGTDHWSLYRVRTKNSRPWMSLNL